MPNRSRNTLRNLLEFIPAWILLKLLWLLPRKAALRVGRFIALAGYCLHARLRETARRNLVIAMPGLSDEQRRSIVKGVFLNLGRLLGEFSQFPKIDRGNIDKLVVYDGFENYRRASEKGRGVLLLTGHVGAWELCAFAHGVYGHPLSFLVRPLDNPLIDSLIARYRAMSGNTTIDKNNSVKPVLSTLKRGKDVGLLIDVNVVGDQGVFCDFFGIPACSTKGLAVFALRSEAPVIPGFLIWNETDKRHHLVFEPEVEVVRTGDFNEEVRINTARFTKVIEECARRHPDQWLWIHKRWHTRPEGEPDLYNSPAPVLPPRSSLKPDVEAGQAATR